MNVNTVACRALIALFIIALICSPVSAYSADATTLFNTGLHHTMSGNYTLAVAAYDNAITLEPGYFEAWNGKADALNRNGQFTDALAASNRSLEINPDYVNGWINRGQILYNIGYEYEDVMHDMEKANALYAEQLRAFEKAVSLDPNNAEAWFNQGYALAGLKRYDEAIDAFDRVKVIDPSYPHLQKNREIAVQLRDSALSPGITTVPTGHETVNTARTPLPSKTSETLAQRPATTPAQPAPFPAKTGIIAILGALFLILQRK